MLSHRVRRNTVLAVMALSLVGSTGCFGSFHLTRKVWTWNKEISTQKWVQELVFLAVTIVPVYQIAGFLDTLIVNSVEFWTGENPVSLTRTIPRENGIKVVETRKVIGKQRVMVFEIFKENKLDRTVTMSHVDGTNDITVQTLYPDGRLDTRTATKFEDGTTLVIQN